MAITNDPIAIGIKKIIKRKGLVQGAVADRAGFTSQKFSNMINNRKVITACDLIPISRALGVNISEIYEAGQSALTVSDGPTERG